VGLANKGSDEQGVFQLIVSVIVVTVASLVLTMVKENIIIAIEARRKRKDTE